MTDEVISEDDTMEIGVDVGNDGTIDHKFTLKGKKELLSLMAGMFALGVAVGMGLIKAFPM